MEGLWERTIVRRNEKDLSITNEKFVEWEEGSGGKKSEISFP